MNRHSALALLLFSFAACAQRATGPAPAVTRIVPLGVAVNVQALRENARYAELVTGEFDSITPENAMKMDSLYPAPEVFAATDADAVVQFAQEQQMQLRGHPLIWHRQLPPWLSQLSETQTNDFLGEHIARVLERYREDVEVWDVVNEAVNSDGSFRASLWFARLGPVYIERAFRQAALHAPDARLFYNDYDLAFRPEKRAAVLWLLDALREEGVRVDGVGFQMHLRPAAMPGPEEIAASFKEVAARGYEVHVTELDVALVLPATAETLAAQATVYCGVASACRAEPACSSLTIWGLGDAYSWIPQVLPGLGAALPFDEQLTPKPAWHALAAGLQGADCSQDATPSE